MVDVALDLDALDVGQAAAADLQRRHLVGLEVGRSSPSGARYDRRAISTSRSKPALSSTVGSLARLTKAQASSSSSIFRPSSASSSREARGQLGAAELQRHPQLALGVLGLERLLDVGEAQRGSTADPPRRASSP